MARRWRDAAILWVDALAEERNPVAAWNVGRALLAVKSPAALKFIRAAAYAGHPCAIDHMRARPENSAVQAGYWERLLFHVTVNGQVPPDEAEPLSALLRNAGGPNASYLKGWAAHHGLFPGIDFDIAREDYGAAARMGHPLAAVALLSAMSVPAYRTAPEENEMTFSEVLARVQEAANTCPPAMLALAVHNIGGARNSRRGDVQSNEARTRLSTAAQQGERGAMEMLGTFDPRPNDYLAHLVAAAELGSIPSMRALARSCSQDPKKAVAWLLKAVDEELPPTIDLRALKYLVKSLRDADNATAALVVLMALDVRLCTLPRTRYAFVHLVGMTPKFMFSAFTN